MVSTMSIHAWEKSKYYFFIPSIILYFHKNLMKSIHFHVMYTFITVILLLSIFLCKIYLRHLYIYSYIL